MLIASLRRSGSRRGRALLRLLLVTAGVPLVACNTDLAAPFTRCEPSQLGRPCEDRGVPGKVACVNGERVCQVNPCEDPGIEEERPARTCGIERRTCGEDGKWGEWVLVPPPERCNGKDDDCDGTADEDSIEPCSPPRDEACNGVDDDRDAEIDEDFPEDGETCQRGVGACLREGRWQCVAGALACDAPLAEPPLREGDVVLDDTCDGVDDDCDGSVDEDPPCNGCDHRLLPDGIPAGFVCIPPPAEPFRMGASVEEDPEADLDEAPVHEVTFSQPFLMEATETTMAQWVAVLGANPANQGGCRVECPVERVSFVDAVAYAQARSIEERLEPCYEIEGQTGDASSGCPGAEPGCFGAFRFERATLRASCAGYRLPTEAEWEYAARGGTTGARWVDDTELELEEAEVCGPAYRSPRPAGAGVPNRFGLYDMLGNVAEWVFDRYEHGLEDMPGVDVDPRVGYPDFSAEPDAGRVVRGGSWSASAENCRSTERIGRPPDFRVDWLGVRLVRPLPSHRQDL